MAANTTKKPAGSAKPATRKVKIYVSSMTPARPARVTMEKTGIGRAPKMTVTPGTKAKVTSNDPATVKKMKEMVKEAPKKRVTSLPKKTAPKAAGIAEGRARKLPGAVQLPKRVTRGAINKKAKLK